MGGKPKVLRLLGGVRLVDRALARIAPQVCELLLSTSPELGELRQTGCPIVHDPLPGHPGPLGGVLAAMQFLLRQPDPPAWLCSVAADTPWFPESLVAALMGASRGVDIVVASSGGRQHPVFALWSLRIAAELRDLMLREGERSLHRVQSRFPYTVVDWPVGVADPFFNLNTPEDLRRARGRLARERTV
jgi:molybdopterin-guanine dinucleotide biosynthesis protein A